MRIKNFFIYTKPQKQKILDLIHSRPRAIAEIAFEIDKNWRTADRYIEQLAGEDLIKTWVFRKGGRGALKIAYWPSSSTSSPSAVRNFLLQRILNGVNKEDFSSLDIVQHIPKEKREVFFLSEESYHKNPNVDNFFERLSKVKSQILFFSGNLSFVDIGERRKEFMKIMEDRIKNEVMIFILTRVDKSNRESILDLLQLNKKGYKGKIEIRYAHQPLRCTVVDEKFFHLKESFSDYSAGSKVNYDKLRGYNIYGVYDEDWSRWISGVFWHLWHGSVNAEDRIKVLDETIERI